jgi:aminoglycoside phosphotransferase (APT) family kinase protein
MTPTRCSPETRSASHGSRSKAYRRSRAGSATRARLHELDIPATLEHGDLHTDNVRQRDGEFAIFDWSDACLSHPFFSLVPYFEFFQDKPLSPTLRKRLRDAYLEAWREVAPRDRLVEASELAELVGPFHFATSYYHLAASTEPRARWEWEGGFGYFVRMLLEQPTP